MIAAASSSFTRNSGAVTPTLVRNIEATFYKFQRHNEMFVVNNTSTGQGTWSWKVLNLETPGITATSSFRSPQFTLPVGHYLIYGECQGLNPNPVARVFWDKRIRVLPAMFEEGDADRVLDLDNGNNIYDASSWADGERIYVKAATTVGRLRIDDFTSATTAHILIDTPMTFNSFVGSHGIYLVNCQNVIIDAVGTTDEYYITLDGIGESTSHGICLNLTSDIRCRNVEIYGVNIQVDEVGASGVRILGDESATYNRVDTTPLEGLKFAHIKGRSGAEFFYLMYTNDTDGGNGGPPKADAPDVWDIDVETCVRNPFQWSNCINGRAHDIRVQAAATSGEPSHNSYVSWNAGNVNCKLFNFTGRGGMHGISVAFGETGTLPMIWNCIFEVETLPGQSTWNFIQTDAGATTDLGIMNVTNICNTGDEIVYRLDASGGNTRDIDRFTLINILSLKGTSANFFTKDGTNPEDNWDRTSGNLSYAPASWATADLDADGYPASVSSPAIDGGVSMTTRYDYADFLGEYDALQFEFDIDGYCKGLDSEFNSGAGAGIPLKLSAL